MIYAMLSLLLKHELSQNDLLSDWACIFITGVAVRVTLWFFLLPDFIADTVPQLFTVQNKAKLFLRLKCIHTTMNCTCKSIA